MNFEEHAAKPLLAAAGISIPKGRVARTPDEAAAIASELGPVVIKAQVPAGKRGKAGGIKPASTAEEAGEAAARILGKRIGEHSVERLLVEQQCRIDREYYAAVLNDSASKGPLVLFSSEGGMDIEEIALTHPDAIYRLPVDIRSGFEASAAAAVLRGAPLRVSVDELVALLAKLYSVYSDNDAELVEINPLAVNDEGGLVALDCKFVLDDSAIKRREQLAGLGVPEQLTGLEAKAKEVGFKYIELDGDIGVLANGAGLTMTTMDVVKHHGGRPANFLEIGGDAYTLATPALELVLSNPKVRSLVINFCGAFARTDVMVDGVVKAWKALEPTIPVFFSVHGTGEVEAVAQLRAELGIEPFDTMDEAIVAAIRAGGAQS